MSYFLAVVCVFVCVCVCFSCSLVFKKSLEFSKFNFLWSAPWQNKKDRKNGERQSLSWPEQVLVFPLVFLINIDLNHLLLLILVLFNRFAFYLSVVLKMKATQFIHHFSLTRVDTVEHGTCWRRHPVILMAEAVCTPQSRHVLLEILGQWLLFLGLGTSLWKGSSFFVLLNHFDETS